MIFSDRQRKILKWTGYPVFAFICFLFFMVSTLPYDKLQDKLMVYARDQMKMNIEIEELSGAFPLGIVARGVTLDSDVDRESRGLPLEIEYLKIKPGIISSLLGWNKLNIRVGIFDGEVDGSVAVDSSGEKIKIDLEFDGLKLEKIGYFKNMFPELPVKGELSSDIELEWNSKQLKESSGKISFNIKKGNIGPGKWQVELPQIRTGDLDASFSIANGKMTVDKYEHSSPDMQSDMNGDFMLSSSPGLWRPNINYRFKLSEDLISKNEIFKLGMSMIQDAKGKEDFYYFSLRGTMQMPRWQANRGLATAFEKAEKGDKGKDAQKNRPATRPETKKTGAASRVNPRNSKATPGKTPPRKPALKDRARPDRAAVQEPSAAQVEKHQDEAPQPVEEDEGSQAAEPVAVEEQHEEDAAVEENNNEEETQTEDDDSAEDKTEEEE